MFKRKKLKLFNLLLRKIFKLQKLLLQVVYSLLRSFFVSSRQQRRQRQAGFVLPTAVMVILVAVLLTTALVLRSFDRAQNASNVRVNQVVLNAASPGIDRAKAKLGQLLGQFSGSTPNDNQLYTALTSSIYNFGDETPLEVVFDINGDGTIKKIQTGQPYVLENDETLTTAWRFPVDTDNNGKFDSYTLYGIYLRSPTRGTNGNFNRTRNPIETRTPPMGQTNLGGQCANGSNSGLLGDTIWYKAGSKLNKSFFVYSATVPITNPPIGNTNYEAYKGNKGFSAIEYQQDPSLIPLNNNTVLFQDDLELTPGSAFRLNGRVFTNANLLAGGHGGAVSLFQVSSPSSCFYQEENSLITVGGNVATGGIGDSTDKTPVGVDLFQGIGNTPTNATIDSNNRSTNSPGGSQVGYNDAAYNQRISFMTATALSLHPGYNAATGTISPVPTVTSVSSVSQYPPEVKSGFSNAINAANGSSLTPQTVLTQQIQLYLQNRTRGVPYAEVSFPDGTGALGTYTTANVFPTGTIEPPAVWRQPLDTNNNLTNTNISLVTSNLQATELVLEHQQGTEAYLGDRVRVGNNLPTYWKDSSGNYVTGNVQQSIGSNIYWTNPSTQLRYRTTQITSISNLGATDRTGFWEDSAAQQPANSVSNVGGLRVITGAGIYVDEDNSATVGTPFFERSTNPSYSFLPMPQLDPSVNPLPLPFKANPGYENIVAWPDSMPMTGGADEMTGQNRKGDLQMRATAVYHYIDSSYTDTNYINRTPTACISSYYDPTNSTTAKNKIIDGGYGVDITNGRSNNGVVYPTPYTNDSARKTAVSIYRKQLDRQARLVFPNGRIVNQSLRDALNKIDANGTRSLADNSALDTAICSLKILDGTIGPPSNAIIPHGTIKEASFLDARQVKANDKSLTAGSIDPISQAELSSSSYDVTNNYNLALEQRQPLEIRVTDINISQLTTKKIGPTGSTASQEYLLPNSGIIYATRDDALADASNQDPTQGSTLSPTDFRLDPTRRPNGVRLFNGSNLARDNNYRIQEKGLILVTNLPAYVMGNFNLHQQPGTTTATEEFLEHLTSNWSNFYSRNSAIDNNFACRQGQTGCGSNGDQWRTATIFSDAISLLSGSWQDGFRNQGDYDLRNNTGSSATQSRKNNGFFENSFVTSAAYWDTTGTSGFPTSLNSYLGNTVTPVQRRIKFPEYVMEICTKLPVEACGPSDWYVNPTTKVTASNVIGQTFNITVHTAGTTAQSARNPANPTSTTDTSFQRYARRIAMVRRISGRLVLTNTTSATPPAAAPIPIGINSSGQITPYPYTQTYNGYSAFSNNNQPRLVNNTLWYRATTNPNNPPDSTSFDYGYSNPLQYLIDINLLSPQTLCVKNTSNTGSIVPCPSTWDSTVANLNLPTTDLASAYTVCVFASNKGNSKSYQTTPSGFTGTCPGTNNDTNTVSGVIKGTRDILASITSPTASGTLTALGGTLIASNDVNVYTLPSGGFNYGATITLQNSISHPNPVFILKAPNGSFNFGANSCSSNCVGVTVTLTGVDENNVFWILDNGSVKFQDVTSPHQLNGTIFGGSAMHMGNNTQIEGRLLGNSNAVQFSTPSNSSVTAVVSTSEPLFAPVLQIHSPEGSPNAGSNLDQGGSDIQNSWLQQPTNDNTFNAVFKSGNSPGRPTEESAGLHNFVRFLENWSGRTTNIKGSFIELNRSAYATGPFTAMLNSMATSGSNTALSIFGYPYPTYKTGNGTPSGTLPFYNAPTRQWGFDVAVLSQSPDLFAQKFTQPSTSPPEEYFSEVGRDHPWITTLLCAVPIGSSSYAVDADQRPICNFPPSSYP